LLLRFVIVVVMGVRYSGAERVPRVGRVLLASNHRTNLDPPLVGCGVDREFSFFAKAELFEVPLLGRLIRAYNAFPVKRGQADRRSVATAVARVRDGAGLILFPEGTRSHTPEFLPPKLGVGLIAKKTGAPIVPTFVGSGGARVVWRSILRIEAIRIVYGDPMDVSAFEGDGAETYQAIADTVMARIAALK
jgi:1-acyl-sn-glycerol-3-phosphate acyltransferase